MQQPRPNRPGPHHGLRLESVEGLAALELKSRRRLAAGAVLVALLVDVFNVNWGP